MNTEWTEGKIRNVLERLDTKTGLHGKDLPMYFTHSKHTLGMYSPKGEFYFSDFYFKDPEFPDELALDVIRHEYAHYMDHILYGKIGHGKTWRACCIVVGAAPCRYCGNYRFEFYKRKNEKDKRIKKKSTSYVQGAHFFHPAYGNGKIILISGPEGNRYITVDFDNVGKKTLNLTWVVQNCKTDQNNSEECIKTSGHEGKKG